VRNTYIQRRVGRVEGRTKIPKAAILKKIISATDDDNKALVEVMFESLRYAACPLIDKYAPGYFDKFVPPYPLDSSKLN